MRQRQRDKADKKDIESDIPKSKLETKPLQLIKTKQTMKNEQTKGTKDWIMNERLTEGTQDKMENQRWKAEQG